MAKDSSHFSFKTKFILIGLLLILNFILRIPSVPHEIGWDSFIIHLMVNSISTFGNAKWWVNPASIFGAYPYAESPSSVPFLLSGISQSSSVNTEYTILIYSFILGIFSVFAAYLMAGSIWNNDIFKFNVAFVFSTFQGILTFSTWTANARTLLIILLPIFIFMLFKIRKFIFRFGLICILFFILFSTTHHMVYFIVPIIFCFFSLIIVYKFKKYIFVKNMYINYILLFGFFVMFLIPFFSRSLMEQDPRGGVGRYDFMLTLFLTYTRYIGPLLIIAIGSLSFLIFKKDKRFEEWFLILSLLSLTQFLYIITYMKWFILALASILVGIGLQNIFFSKSLSEKKISKIFLCILLLIAICFSGYYQFIHFENESSTGSRYMDEQTYNSGIWIKKNINKNMIGSYSEYSILPRIASISEIPTMTGTGSTDLAFGLVDLSMVNISQVYSPLSLQFYFKDPYKVTNKIDENYNIKTLELSNINNPNSFASWLVSKFNLSYYAEYKPIVRSEFTKSLYLTKNILYDNGEIHIWDLGV